jgi:hypothetical protein
MSDQSVITLFVQVMLEGEMSILLFAVGQGLHTWFASLLGYTSTSFD